MYQACLLTPFYIGVTETLRGPSGPNLDSTYMRTETTYASPTVGVGTSETPVPEGLRKLGRLAVWAVSGSQFIDVIWDDGDAPQRSRPSARGRRQRLSQAELADLIGRAEPKARPSRCNC
jgi:hypothetical protein